MWDAILSLNSVHWILIVYYAVKMVRKGVSPLD